MRIKSPGFTLIELLIVVAIIAILAAIAVPNLVQAQSRAQVSRVKSDMRSLANALESYNVDWEAFPLPNGPEGQPVGPGFYPSIYATRLPVGLTTPISYFGRLLSDPFEQRPGAGIAPFHYTTRQYAKHTTVIDGGVVSYDLFVSRNLHADQGESEWLVLSYGPDGIHDASPAAMRLGAPGSSRYAPYDPTNGTKSAGDLVYFGSSIGFKE